jgi:hypothetical protein
MLSGTTIGSKHDLDVVCGVIASNVNRQTGVFKCQLGEVVIYRVSEGGCCCTSSVCHISGGNRKLAFRFG